MEKKILVSYDTGGLKKYQLVMKINNLEKIMNRIKINVCEYMNILI